MWIKMKCYEINKIKKNYIGVKKILLIIIVCFFDLSMSGQGYKLNEYTVEIPNWQKQLEYAINNPCLEDMGDARYLTLINYMYQGKIDTNIDRLAVIDSLLADNAPAILNLLPVIKRKGVITENCMGVRNIEFAKFEIVSMHRIVEIELSASKEDPTMQMRKQLEQLIEIGFESVRLEWNFKGKTFHSICIVSEKYGGIVYEPIGYSTVVFKVQTTFYQSNYGVLSK